MEIEQIQALVQVGQNITVAGVLLAWIISERMARNKLSDEIIDDWRDMKARRIHERFDENK